MKHKHYDVLIAIAEGKKVEARAGCKDNWEEIELACSYACNPISFPDWEWRVKKEPLPDIIRTCMLSISKEWKHVQVQCQWIGENTPNGYKHNHFPTIQLIFDGETEELKDVKIIR